MVIILLIPAPEGIFLWTWGELNPHLSNANAMFYRLTTGPYSYFNLKTTPKGGFLCGPDRTRTDYLFYAIEALYQVSYGPKHNLLIIPIKTPREIVGL